MYAKDLEEPKYQLLIKKREQAGTKNLEDKNAFIEYSNSIYIMMVLMTTIKREKEKY